MITKYMSRTNYKTVLDTITQEVKSMDDEKVQSILTSLLNLVEALIDDNDQLRAENQRLRDENNRLKGEQGKPSIRKQTQPNKNISSEKERARKNRKNKKSRKKHKIAIDKVEICSIDNENLPADAVFKGHQSVVVQDIVIKTNNIEFKKEVYYSPSLKKTFSAVLPKGYDGEFGPAIKALIISLYHDLKVTESNIHKLVTNHGIYISTGSISNFLINDHEQFHEEKQAIVAAGLDSTDYQQMDDTSARVAGKNYYVHVLCNEFYSAYFTRRHKDRLTIIEILTQTNLQFTFNDKAFVLMKEMNLSAKMLNKVTALYAGKTMSRQVMDALLLTFFPNPHKQLTNRQIILESAAIAAYQSLSYATQFLLTDDAPQYNKIAAYHPLCWVHDGRHYKKLNPLSGLHRKKLDHFITQYWDYYGKLRDFKAFPTKEAAQRLSTEFDHLFSTKTGYDKLDERIEKTNIKKAQLLLVLSHPTLPLHNNDSELAARDQARRRDINYHTMNDEGTASKDTFMTIAQTAKKLAVNFYQYAFDRISKKYELPSLASLITQQATQLA
jgi:hypothetical protein